MWAKQDPEWHRTNEPAPTGDTPFWHASKHSMDNATHIDASMRRGVSSGSYDDVNWFSGGKPPHQRNAYGSHVYRVEPTGPFTDNFDAQQVNGEYASDRPLRLLSKVQFGQDGRYQGETPMGGV